MPDEEKIQKIELAVIQIASDVKHLTNRVEDGISSTVTAISEKMNEIVPIVKDHAWWISKVKAGVFHLALLGLVGGIVLTIVWFSRFSE